MCGHCLDYKSWRRGNHEKVTVFSLQSTEWNRKLDRLSWLDFSSDSKSTEIFANVTGGFCWWKIPLYLILGENVFCTALFVFFKNTIYYHWNTFFFTKALKNCNFFLNTEVDFITMIQANWKWQMYIMT